MQLRFLICICFIFTHLSHAFATPVCIGVGLCEQITNQSAMSLNITLWVKLLDNGLGEYAADLDGTVPSSVGDGSIVQLMIRSLMSKELYVWQYIYMLLPLLLFAISSRCYWITYHLLHALYMQWRFVRNSVSDWYVVKNDSRFCLQLRARVAIGIKRIERMPFRQLIQLHNSHAPLLYLEASRQLPGTNKLCRIMKEASLSDLSYINNASDIISRNVEKVLSQNLKYVKQQRLWERVACKLNQRHFDDHTIEMFKFVILVLSLFENNNEDIKTVILYGVPGLPSVSLSDSATYADIRAMIVQRAPNLRDFYFVAHGRIIHIENTVIDWGSGHLVLNVHTTKDLPGGSMPGSSDSERSDRNRNKLSDLQQLLLSDASGDEDLDDSISHGGSDSDSFQDSHGIVRQINNGTERNVIPKGEKSLH